MAAPSVAADLHEERFGSTGPVIVLMSGISSSTDVWRSVANDLATDHRVRVLSIPGMGGVPKQSSSIDSVALLGSRLSGEFGGAKCSEAAVTASWSPSVFAHGAGSYRA